MIHPEAIHRFSDQQKRLLRSTYDAAWQQGVDSYEPDDDPPPDQVPEGDRDHALAGLTGAALLAARRLWPYAAPSEPDPLARAAALAPALASLNSMTGELATLSPADVASAEIGSATEVFGRALQDWATSNAYRLDNGDSVAWAGEQGGYAQAADADGRLLEWVTESDEKVCFPAGTMVTTGRGPVAIESIRNGDLVLTHEGRWRPVRALMRRAHHDVLVRISVRDRSVIATPNHPFLIEVEGQLFWRAAGDISIGDLLVAQQVCETCGHTRVERPVKRLGRQANNSITTSDEIGVAPLVARATVASVVPVGPVDFEHDAADQKVGGIATDRRLLSKRDVQLAQRQAYVALGRRLSAKAPPAGSIAKAIAANSPRAHAKRLAAGGAGNVSGRAIALLGAVSSRAAHRLTASFAWVFRQVGLRPWPTPIRAILSGTRMGEDNRKALAATLADLHDAMVDRSTPARAVLGYLARPLSEVLAAPGTDAYDSSATAGREALARAVPPGRARKREYERSAAVLAHAQIRRLPEPFVGAVVRAVEVLPAVCEKRSPASATDELHAAILSSTIVYNLEVEGDHSYVANGFVVHNCDDCTALGEMPPQPLADWPSQPGDGATACNVGCRCCLQASEIQVIPGDEYVPPLSDAQQGVVSSLIDARQAALNSTMPDAQYLE